jgi:hypothetical protein
MADRQNSFSDALGSACGQTHLVNALSWSAGIMLAACTRARGVAARPALAAFFCAMQGLADRLRTQRTFAGEFLRPVFVVKNHFQHDSTTADFIGVRLSKCLGQIGNKGGLSQNCHIRAVKKGVLPWSALRQRLRSRGRRLLGLAHR